VHKDQGSGREQNLQLHNQLAATTKASHKSTRCRPCGPAPTSSTTKKKRTSLCTTI
jgi:hypothetical protein